MPKCDAVEVAGSTNLLGAYTETVLDEIVRRVAPDAAPLPTTYEESA